MTRRIQATRRLLTIGEELQRENARNNRRTFFVLLGNLIGALILLGIIWFE